MSGALDKFGCIGNTIKVVTGHYVDLADPDPETIDIEAISAALGKICRFGGHCPIFYSVAEHSVHAVNLASIDEVCKDGLRAILLHDAAEAYIGDIVKPLKLLLPEYDRIEKRLERAIEKRFDTDFDRYRELIKKYDRLMLKAEKTRMWPDDNEVWSGFSEIENRQVEIEYWDPECASGVFLGFARFVGI